MGLIKHGTGSILPEPEDRPQERTAAQQQADQEALRREQQQADRDERR